MFNSCSSTFGAIAKVMFVQSSDRGVFLICIDRQVLVTHASGLALMSLMSSCPDHRGLEVSVDNADPFVGMFITVNVTMFVIIMG